MVAGMARANVHRSTPVPFHLPVTIRSAPRLMMVIRHAGPLVVVDEVFVHVSVPATPEPSMSPTIGRCASSLSWFAWFVDAFHAIKHARSDGCVGGAAAVVLAEARATITATSAQRAMNGT